MATPAAFQPLNAQSIQRALSTKALGRTLHVMQEVASTNTAAATLAHDDAPHGTVVVAESQTAGRGRLGRHWHSPEGKNLYCSILLSAMPERKQQPLWLSWVPLIAALAVSRAVQTVAGGLKPSVKWPNDILAGNRKLGGVLCESSGIGTDHANVIVGIGLNVNVRRDEFPEELREIATSLAIEAGHPCDRAALLAALLVELESRCESFLAGNHGDILDEYLLRCSTIGRRVRIELAHGEHMDGTADSIRPDGSLRILRDDRTPVDIRAGDVIHLR
jgi:BirA family transcriptional regulator, biotin operon repressor / biotin---[acetyl-CoA-carboxylase] ligase